MSSYGVNHHQADIIDSGQLFEMASPTVNERIKQFEMWPQDQEAKNSAMAQSRMDKLRESLAPLLLGTNVTGWLPVIPPSSETDKLGMGLHIHALQTPPLSPELDRSQSESPSPAPQTPQTPQSLHLLPIMSELLEKIDAEINSIGIQADFGSDPCSECTAKDIRTRELEHELDDANSQIQQLKEQHRQEMELLTSRPEEKKESTSKPSSPYWMVLPFTDRWRGRDNRGEADNRRRLSKERKEDEPKKHAKKAHTGPKKPPWRY